MPNPKIETNSRVSIEKLKKGWIELARGNSFISENFLSMTYRPELDKNGEKLPIGEETPGDRIFVTPDKAFSDFRWLVRRINEYVGGQKYQRKWGHSYFSYIWGSERHKDGVFHSHAVVDCFIPYGFCHEFWRGNFGGLWIRPSAAGEVDTKYCLKYVLKYGDSPTYFFQKRRRRVEPATGLVYVAGERKTRPVLTEN